jgi:hypothetical protein
MSKTGTNDAIAHDLTTTGRVNMAVGRPIDPPARELGATVLHFPTAPEFADAIMASAAFAMGGRFCL